ncbi:hypothetical protein MFIFM68171_10578 [Madurella fahalii]|uniref:Uncharacterized protein n=1 Tax=Madurella fahalii TaxID=1157608 RepID=A0ABQ0GRK6_9PEZI
MKRIVLHDTEDGNARSRTAVPATPEPRTTTPAPSRQQQPLPPELIEIVIPSLKVGAVAGACGLFAGAAAGIVRSAPTVFFSVITGGQWFTLATSYYGARQVALNHFGGEEVAAPTDKVKASTVAGGVAGTFGGLLRGPRNVLPGALMFSLFGAGGQAIANWRAAKAAKAPPTPSKGFWARWSPFTRLSDPDYEKILEERLLRVEVDIAMIDDHIKELREAEKQIKKGAVGAERRDPASPSRD